MIGQKPSTPLLQHSSTPIPFSYRNISRNFLLQFSISSLLGSFIVTICSSLMSFLNLMTLRCCFRLLPPSNGTVKATERCLTLDAISFNKWFLSTNSI
jgi:hypothetical protein